MPLIQGQIAALANPSYSDGTTTANLLQGKSAELLCAEIHGKWYTQAYRGNLYFGAVTAVTLPVNANNLASVCSLYNPAGSTRNLELVSVSVGTVLATTVVNNVNIYFQGGIGSSVTIPSAITVGTINGGFLGSALSSQGKFCSALTHVGTPTLLTQVANFGAVTTTNFGVVTAEFDGKIILPPASVISIANSTAASTASGMAVSICWAEVAL
jgi:hypothetical protein